MNSGRALRFWFVKTLPSSPAFAAGWSRSLAEVITGFRYSRGNVACWPTSRSLDSPLRSIMSLTLPSRFRDSLNTFPFGSRAVRKCLIKLRTHLETSIPVRPTPSFALKKSDTRILVSQVIASGALHSDILNHVDALYRISKGSPRLLEQLLTELSARQHNIGTSFRRSLLALDRRVANDSEFGFVWPLNPEDYAISARDLYMSKLSMSSMT